MLTLHDGTTSVCAIKVRLTLAEKGLEWTSRSLDLRRGDQFDPEYLKLNPGAVVPTLVNGDDVIVESSVIMQYLEDLAPAPSLLPASPAERARMRLWLKRIDDPVHPACGVLTHATAFRQSFLAKSPAEQEAHFAKIPDLGRRARQRAVYRDGLDAPIVADAVRTHDRLLSDMEAALADAPFLAGRGLFAGRCGGNALRQPAQEPGSARRVVGNQAPRDGMVCPHAAAPQLQAGDHRLLHRRRRRPPRQHRPRCAAKDRSDTGRLMKPGCKHARKPARNSQLIYTRQAVSNCARSGYVWR